jgi:G3E family GTPase
MSNGCICCTLREDLMIEVEKLAKENRFDYLLIESTGISEPIPIAQTFSFIDEENGIDLSKFSYVDTMVTVVDAFNFFKDFGTSELLEDRNLTENEEDKRTIVNLLTDQIEFANVIILNKTDLSNAKDLALLKALLKKLNPEAKIIESLFSKVNLHDVLDTKLFDFETASNAAGWIKELNEEHVPETEEYGIGSMVFRDNRPFHPKRFKRFLNDDFPNNIIRSKGLFWTADNPSQASNFSQAGGSSRLDSAGVWWGSMKEEERLMYQDYQDNKDYIKAKWSLDFDDRLNELVFIGQDLDKDDLKFQLENCLLTDEEIIEYKNGCKFEELQQTV